MTYLKYSNLCADMVRASLKDPLRTTAKTREAVYFRASMWEDGKPVKRLRSAHAVGAEPFTFMQVHIARLLVSKARGCLAANRGSCLCGAVIVDHTVPEAEAAVKK